MTQKFFYKPTKEKDLEVRPGAPNAYIDKVETDVKPKFIMPTKHLKKVDVKMYVPEPKSEPKKVDLDNMSLEDIEALMRDNEEKIYIKKGGLPPDKEDPASVYIPRDTLPKKPPKKKRAPIPDVIIFGRWSPIIRTWVDKTFNKEDRPEIAYEKDSNRIDILGDTKRTGKWRMSLLAHVNAEFDVSLYCNYTNKASMYGARAVKVEYIKVEDLELALDFAYGGLELFVPGT